MNTIECVIFDLDGVIVSTDEYHYKAWKYLADIFAIPFGREVNEKLRGVSRMESLEILLQGTDKKFSTDKRIKMTDLKNNYYVKSLADLTANDILPGVLPIINELKNKGIQIAIGSSSKNAKRILKQINLVSSFNFIADGTQISKSKPNPEVFLKVAESLGLQSKKCFVVEDAEAGVLAAKNAGMKVLGIGAASTSELADFRARDLTEVNFFSLIS